MANCQTVDRILRAATVLFSERGFAETSLRTITGMADVNLAAVNYHFGTKKSLIQSVFSHFLGPFCRELDKRLDKLEKELIEGEAPDVEHLLRILLESLRHSADSINEDPQRFMRLLSLAYTQSQEHLRRYLLMSFGSTYERYIGWVHKAHPQLDPVAFYWRINFILGATIFTLSSFESIQAILSAEHGVEMDMDGAVAHLVPALAGTLAAPNRAP